MARTYKYQKIKNSVKQQSTEALVEQFNALVGKRCWASARAAHDAALIDTLVGRGIDVSAIYDGESISFRDHVVLNEDLNKLFVVK
jgi:cobalamin biosynthesis protein CbiG